MIYIILLVLLAIIIWFVSGYNKLVKSKTLVDEAWAGIDVQLKRRYDLIPNLVESVKGYTSHEKSVFENVAKYRSIAMGSPSIEEKTIAEANLTGALKTLFAVAESYPELKANQNFLSLQTELTNIETELQLARRYYNGSARNYNIRVDTFPSNIVATVTNFKKVPYFEVAAPQEKEAPKIKF